MLSSGMPPEEIRVDHIDVTSFIERLSDLIDQVLTHDVIIQLLGSTDVQGEPSHFATDFTLTGFVPVILGTSGREFGDAVAIIEFVRHLP